jgi:ABC-type Mn2+/Zn2+ transport system ATPase subunit
MFKDAKHSNDWTEWVSQAEKHDRMVPVTFQTLLGMFSRKSTNQELKSHSSQDADCLIRSIHASQLHYQLIFEIKAMNKCVIY